MKISELRRKLKATFLPLLRLKGFHYLREEHILAKRRNLKKEKAERNQAYARQFRQKSSRSFSRGRSYSNNSKDQEDNNDDDNNKS